MFKSGDRVSLSSPMWDKGNLPVMAGTEGTIIAEDGINAFRCEFFVEWDGEMEKVILSVLEDFLIEVPHADVLR